MAATNDHGASGNADLWPALRYDDWKDTCATLQLWTQVVGKIRLKLAPMVNHWWQVTLYVTASGLTTSAMPHQGRFVQIDFDFLAHRLILRTSDGRTEAFPLQPRSVADFYAEVMARLRALGVDIKIGTMPSEIEGAVPFERDREHAAYDADAAQRFWRQLVQADRVMNMFRGRFLGPGPGGHREAEPRAARQVALRHALREVADAADVGGAFGHRDCAARLEHIEEV